MSDMPTTSKTLASQCRQAALDVQLFHLTRENQDKTVGRIFSILSKL